MKSRAPTTPSPSGLSAAEARRLMGRHGPNELPAQGGRGLAAIVWDALREPMIALLLACGGLYLALGDAREAATLGGAIAMILSLAVWQEAKTERALEALRELSSPRALALRDGAPARIPARELVPGDVVLLEEGDRVPADAALLESAGLGCDESLLTGESVPVSKRDWDGRSSPGRPGGDEEPFLWSGTLVVRGRGKAAVLRTGTRTELGRIGSSLASLQPEKTALHRETARLVRGMGAVAFAVCALVALGYGLSRGSWVQGLLAGLTIAISLVPEEFPVVLTVFLALGAWRMSARRVLVRRAAAVEALGAATVLCADKTGTLTQNRMSVVKARPASGGEEARELLRLAALASRPEPVDPMERAFHEAGGLAPDAEGLTLEREYPLENRRLALLWREGSGARLAAAKGAPESILELCAVPAPGRAAALELVRDWGARGLRVIAVASARPGPGPLPSAPEELAWRYEGLAALADPLRPSARPSIRSCARAGIRVLMVTGDHPATALGIARELGLEGGAVLGAELEGLDDRELGRRLRAAAVVARVLPEQKLRVVRALKSLGEVVAMTGDGVNDAPALKAADIGVAMGGRGSDVAREAASVVLLDDDFGTLVEGVRQGRRIFDNIRKAMAFVVSVHIPIAALAMAPVAAGWPLLLLPAHILFLEMVIDPACSVVFEADPGEERLMERPPRDSSEPILDRRALLLAAAQGAAAGLLVVAVAAWGMSQGWPEGKVRAAAFASIVAQNLSLLLVWLSGGRGLLSALATPNRAFRLVALGASGVLVLALALPGLRELFHFAPLGLDGAAAALVSGAGGLGCVRVMSRLRARTA